MNPLAHQLHRLAGGDRLPCDGPTGGLAGRQGRSVSRSVFAGPVADGTTPQQMAAESSSPAASGSGNRLARLEAVLLVAKEALSTRRLAQLASLADGTEARTLVGQLAQRYNKRGRAFQVVNVAGGYRLLTRAQFAPWVTKIQPSEEEVKLTPPALDTLAVVAYRQPVVRAEVEAIRGVGCGELLRQLIERDLLRIVGRSEELGRPLQYGTTKSFLQLFGLRSLEDLPPLEVHASQEAGPSAEPLTASMAVPTAEP